jgi:hypothetical protein
MNGEENDTRARLVNIIHDWIREDPTLKWHFEVRDFRDEFCISTKCQEGRSYIDAAVAWVKEDSSSKILWYHLKDSKELEYNNDVWDNISPADPSYFERMRKMMIDGHNGATFTTAKGNKWHSRRKGCSSNI